VTRAGRPIPRRWLAQDAALAALLVALGLAEVWVPFSSRQGHGSETLTSVGVLVAGMSVVARRGHPLVPLTVFVVANVVLHLVGPVYVLFYGQFLVLLVGLFSAARHGRGREPWLGALLGALALVYIDLAVPELGAPSERVFHWGVCTLVWLAGFGLQRHERNARESLQRAIDTEVAAAEQAMAAVVDERGRIARELHDIVAHSVSTMVVQAGAAEQAVDDPEYVRAALASIRETGAGALAEMRRTLSLLRDSEADLAPQPGIAEGLPALVEAARTAGLEVVLEVQGAERTLPAGLDLAAYRIVQEALSNVRRHASASHARVVLSYADDAVRIEVHDDGVGSSDLRPGHGLIGMRERAALYGGHLETETAAGFTVRALLPVAGP
jgi:signal transduction histidine kinase